MILSFELSIKLNFLNKCPSLISWCEIICQIDLFDKRCQKNHEIPRCLDRRQRNRGRREEEEGLERRKKNRIKVQKREARSTKD